MWIRGKAKIWAGIAIGLALASAGCSNDACEVVANQMRQCCAKGPADLRESCEKEATGLAQDGNSKACQALLDDSAYEACAP